MSTMAATEVRTGGMTKDERFVILASSLGTVFEWYDFLSLRLARQHHRRAVSSPPIRRRPAIFSRCWPSPPASWYAPSAPSFFGRIGDIVGRKYTFLVTILIMGLSTFIVGPAAQRGNHRLCRTGDSDRVASGARPGARWRVMAEPPLTWPSIRRKAKRGYYTSFIQTTATLGLFLSLLVILFTRTALGEADFAAWGWRIPFLVSVFLLGISVWIRLRLNESPVFQKMKDEGKGSKAPLTEAFANWSNAKIVILALIGGTMGQGVVWYTGQFYALFFLQSILKVDGYTANLLIAWSLFVRHRPSSSCSVRCRTRSAASRSYLPAA